MPEIHFPILAERDDAGYVGNAPNTIGKLARVSKATARSLYDQGVEIIIVANKFMPYPDATNGVAMRMPRDCYADAHTFDNVVCAYTHANCTHETGYYPAFWVRFDAYHVYARNCGRDLHQGTVQAPTPRR